MSGRDPTLLEAPDDLQHRVGDLRNRIEAGEAMTMQYIAEALGLPFEFIAPCIGMMLALKSGARVVIDPAEIAKPN